MTFCPVMASPRRRRIRVRSQSMSPKRFARTFWDRPKRKRKRKPLPKQKKKRRMQPPRRRACGLPQCPPRRRQHQQQRNLLRRQVHRMLCQRRRLSQDLPLRRPSRSHRRPLQLRCLLPRRRLFRRLPVPQLLFRQLRSQRRLQRPPRGLLLPCQYGQRHLLDSRRPHPVPRGRRHLWVQKPRFVPLLLPPALQPHVQQLLRVHYRQATEGLCRARLQVLGSEPAAPGPANQCVQCSQAVKDDPTPQDPVGPEEREVRRRTAHLNSGAEQFPREPVRDRVCLAVLGCFLRCRTKCHPRRNPASRFTRGSPRRGNGLSLTSGRSRASASFTRRASGPEQAIAVQRLPSSRRRNRARRAT